MTLADESMTEQTRAVEHLATDDAVQDIGLGAMTVDARSISPAHADVVEHRSLLDKLDVKRLTLVDETLTKRYRHVSDLTAMRNQHPVIVVTGCIVSFNNG
jgi:hypothetical protein